MPPDPLNGLGLTVELNPGPEKSGNLILSGKWQDQTKMFIILGYCEKSDLLIRQPDAPD